MFYPVVAGFAVCHESCARKYWVVVYCSMPCFQPIPGHRSFEDDPGPRLYLSLS